MTAAIDEVRTKVLQVAGKEDEQYVLHTIDGGARDGRVAADDDGRGGVDDGVGAGQSRLERSLY